ncbi:MAG: DUF1580 domain-containing protein [Candidatus Anammoximicrobium sp.]|nr:DUF1580 domain-containing protein [Candidatus Anammoximicrobium sp.]
MRIDLTRERLLNLICAAKSIPVAPSTIWRWHRHGVKGCRLDTILIGGKRFTSVEALQRFSEALTAADERSRDGEDAVQSPAARDESTVRRLEKAGLLQS